MKKELLKRHPKPRDNQLVPLLQYIAIITFCLILGFPGQAEAYLDPTTGGFLFQLILGGIAGIATIYKFYGKKIKELFNRFKKK